MSIMIYLLRLFSPEIIFFISIMPCLAKSGTVALSDEDNGIAVVEINVPFGEKYDYNDIKCTKVIDGDTILLENGQRVRLIGVDTPETYDGKKLDRDAEFTGRDTAQIKAMGRKSTEFTRTIVEGKRIKLEFDLEKRDKYSRLLAYVFIIIDKDIPSNDNYYISTVNNKPLIFLNAALIKSGYAGLLTIPPNVKYSELFQSLYEEAREEKRGLWRQTKPYNRLLWF